MNIPALVLMFFGIMSRTKDEKRISGRWFPNGSSAVDNTLNVGYGFTVTRLATAGLFRIDFEKPFPKLANFEAKVNHATTYYHAPVTSVITDTQGRVTGVTIQVYTSAVSATITDITAAATSWIGIEATVIDSRVR